MEDVKTTTVHQFGQGLLVEIIGTDEHGDIATETIEFDLIESGDAEPREEIPSEHEEHILTAISEEGYSLLAS
ncbi:hypothetical protein [Halomontanus rarus]|uniref:hypothetical protein n=1 Tax=Halomontanus rarus TaxID=3034020 RepID=UPI001A98F6CF